MSSCEINALHPWLTWLWLLTPFIMAGFAYRYIRKKNRTGTTHNRAEIRGGGNVIVQAGENSSVNVSLPDSPLGSGNGTVRTDEEGLLVRVVDDSQVVEIYNRPGALQLASDYLSAVPGASVLFRSPGSIVSVYKSQKIVIIVEQLRELGEQGQWGLFNGLAKLQMKMATDEDEKMMILQEVIAAAYFQDRLDLALKKLQQATELHVTTANPSLHLLKILYLKAAVKRKAGNYKEAESAIYDAEKMATFLTPGIESAGVFYNRATLIAQQISDSESPNKDLFQRARDNFLRAISDYKAEGTFRLTSHSKLGKAYVRLGMLLLDIRDKGEDQPRPVANDALRMAENCLQVVKGNMWEGIASRTRCYWHLAKSDLALRRRHVQDAENHAKAAIEIAQQSPFPSEVSLAQSRLDMLSRNG
ncbi:Hypp285 [Branchiostoma lanceolatum]|uniref:Hypp285 protein n=1 Tax=Branchiostoma lanceolatum TaxID=7740 RepID=A0A8J9VL06_BRALA|nr:Hypp285 [Branchiostoma lanceolatum]